MNKYIKTLLAGAVIAGLSSCTDYLNEKPESSLIPESYFTEASLMEAYLQPFYLWFPSHSDDAYKLGIFSLDNNTDNQAAQLQEVSSMFMKNVWLTPQSASVWDWSNIRKINYFFDYAEKNFEEGTISGTTALINQSMGEAHFFRAYAYWAKYKDCGDYPIITTCLPDNRDVLIENSVRQPRHKVARFILDELTEAINLLPETNSKGKNGLNKACAQLFRSRVALFEGTWLKYHKGTALVPGGPGWPGDASKLEGFNIDDEIRYFLTEAMNSAKPVADDMKTKLAANTEAEEGMDSDLNSLNPYYTMFCETNLNSYDEVLLYRSYSQSQSVTTQIQAQFQKDAGGSGWTRGMVNSFLMKNGLPIYDPNSGYQTAWENDGVTATLRDRDSRIVIFTKGDNCVDTYNMSTKAPVYYNMGWLLFGQYRTQCTTGYAVKKGKGYDYTEAAANNASYTASIVFRGVEAMLNYMEAYAELNNGNVNDVAEGYWKAIRERAKVDTDFTKTIAATVMTEEAKGDWGAYSAGALIQPNLYNIRRERRNELCAEGLRMDDLRRWAAMDQLITTPYIVEGIKYWGTCYNDPSNPLGMKDQDGNYLPPVVNMTSGEGTMSPEANGPYVRPYQVTTNNNNVYDGLTFMRAHYLWPIGEDNFKNASPTGKLEGTVIYQNPGWSMHNGDAPSSI